MKTWMVVSGAIMALVVIYFILAFFFKLPPFSKKKEEPEDTETTLLSSPVSLETMDISGSSEEESETSGYMMTSYYNIGVINPTLKFNIKFSTPDDPGMAYVEEWDIYLVSVDSANSSNNRTLVQKNIPYDQNSDFFQRGKNVETGNLGLDTTVSDVDLGSFFDAKTSVIKVLIFYKNRTDGKYYNALHIDDNDTISGPFDDLTNIYNIKGNSLYESGNTDNNWDYPSFLLDLDRITRGELNRYETTVSFGLGSELTSTELETSGIDEKTVYNLYIVYDDNGNRTETKVGDGLYLKNSESDGYFKIVNAKDPTSRFLNLALNNNIKYTNHPKTVNSVLLVKQNDNFIRYEDDSLIQQETVLESTTSTSSDAFILKSATTNKVVLPTTNFLYLLQTIDDDDYDKFKEILQTLVDYIKTNNINFKDLSEVLKIFTLRNNKNVSNLALICINTITADGVIDSIRYLKHNNNNRYSVVTLGTQDRLGDAFSESTDDLFSNVLSSIYGYDYEINDLMLTKDSPFKFVDSTNNKINLFTNTTTVYNNAVKEYNLTDKVYDRITEIVFPIAK